MLLILPGSFALRIQCVYKAEYECVPVNQVMVNPERLSKTAETIVEDFCWVQWDGHTQRLYYLTDNDKFLIRCVQFYPYNTCETVLELPLELPANPFCTVTFVNLGFDHYHTERPDRKSVV